LGAPPVASRYVAPPRTGVPTPGASSGSIQSMSSDTWYPEVPLPAAHRTASPGTTEGCSSQNLPKHPKSLSQERFTLCPKVAHTLQKCYLSASLCKSKCVCAGRQVLFTFMLCAHDSPAVAYRTNRTLQVMVSPNRNGAPPHRIDADASAFSSADNFHLLRFSRNLRLVCRAHRCESNPLPAAEPCGRNAPGCD